MNTEYFKRQIELWGEETQQILATKSIAIIGAGGLGSSLCFGLGSVGIGTIHIVDFDKVSFHNIHRQIAFTLQDEEKNKAEVNAQVIKSRSNFTQTFSYACSFMEWIKKDIKVDLIIDATDNLQTRADIDKYAKEHDIVWIYGSVEAFNAQVCFFENANFCDFFKITKHTPAGIATPMVMQVASFQANLALRYLSGLPVKKDYVYYIFFNDEGMLVTQSFSL